jgi:F-type H+-transporting ATPase subunit b
VNETGWYEAQMVHRRENDSRALNGTRVLKSGLRSGGLLSLFSSAVASASENLEILPDAALPGVFGDGGLGTMWVMLVGFVVLIFPLNALIFQPIFRALDARADRIQGARGRSAQLQSEADAVLEQYEQAIREARAEAEAARQRQLALAREEQASLTSAARRDAEGELERARADLGRSLEEARNTLRAGAEDLAQAAAEQVLGRALS